MVLLLDVSPLAMAMMIRCLCAVATGQSAGIGDLAGLDVQQPFRCRNFTEQSRANHQIIAEEMLLWGWRVTPHKPQQKEFLEHAEAKALLA